MKKKSLSISFYVENNAWHIDCLKCTLYISLSIAYLNQPIAGPFSANVFDG